MLRHVGCGIAVWLGGIVLLDDADKHALGSRCLGEAVRNRQAALRVLQRKG